MTSIAIMQPYFVPYAGYFRLMEAADIFVIYDCVQFPRRGYVHRNQVLNENKTKSWLTLPLVKQPRSVRINQLEFRTNAFDELLLQISSKPIYRNIKFEQPLYDLIFDFTQSPVCYITHLLQYFCKKLDIETQFIFSSDLNIDNSIMGQDRIISIAKTLGSKNYINAPNGRKLYQSQQFNKENLTLNFLPEYKGSYISIVEDYYDAKMGNKELSKKIKQQSIYSL